MSQTTLVFSIGPVQGFIAQSRRTADGWVGSYLLSYLMGHALAAVESRSYVMRIVEPAVESRPSAMGTVGPHPRIPMYEAIKDRTGRKVAGDTTIAALPNVALLEVQPGAEAVIAEAAQAAAEEAGWKPLCARFGASFLTQ